MEPEAMPELPEVETVVRQLRPRLVGSRVRGGVVHAPGLIRCQAAPPGALVGAVIRGVRRRGKFIRLDLSAGRRAALRRTARRAAAADATKTGADGDLAVLVHLRMTGRLTVVRGRPPRDRHDHIDLLLSGNRVLRFRDVRKLGGWWIMPAEMADAAAPLADLGPEPLEIPCIDFRRLLAGRRQRIKALLLDQRRLAGMGNIYCDESLFASGIHPAARAGELSARQANRLWSQMRRILRAAIERRGSTISDFRRPDGSRGGYQDHFRVYGRADLPCPRCRATLRRTIVAGRGTTFCPRCQRARSVC
jgi:formamidopyrimidine-DNA glycosylase